MFSAFFVSIDFQWMSSEKAIETTFQNFTQFHNIEQLWQ